MGCIDANRDIQGYTGIKSFMEETDVPRVADKVTVMIRSVDDPIVQAIYITNGTFNMGMDPALQMLLGIFGCLTALVCVYHICRQCKKISEGEKEAAQRLRMASYMMDNEVPGSNGYSSVTSGGSNSGLRGHVWD